MDYSLSSNLTPGWNINTPTTTTPLEAQRRLDSILLDKLLWFNPYRIADRPLLDCAERGRWSQFPSITQIMVYHFSDIRSMRSRDVHIQTFDALFFRVGNLENESYFGVCSLTHPMTHVVTRRPVWALINGRHLVPSNVHTLEGRDVFISHAINCVNPYGNLTNVSRMHLLSGSDKKRAAIVRKAMCESKISMLEEVMRYPIHPQYLGNACYTFDYKSPILRAIELLNKYPSTTPPTVHIIP